VRRRHPDAFGAKELTRILRAERARGRADGRPAVKLATVEELVRTGRRR
jgi:ferredoxin--NADP+ reductase